MRMQKKTLTALLIAMIIIVWGGPPCVAEVGYVNILNGIEPAQAFVVERQGQTIIPEGIYTNLEEADVVKPSAEALLLFTPTDAACEVVELQGEFTATACSPSPGGLKDMAYDFVASEFMAAPDESVGVFATRGAEDKRVHSLPPRALRLYVENKALAESLKKTPFLALTGSKSEAEALLMGPGPVKVLSPGQTEGRQFNLTTEKDALRQALLNRINFQTMATLISPGAWPDFEWSINIYTEGADGSLDYDDRKWILVKTINAGHSTPVMVQEPCVLTFKLANNSSKAYYAYLVNYTSSGLLLPFLPSPEAPQFPNLVAAGKDLTLPHIYLELGESQENLRLIISENPLDLSPFIQDNLDAPSDAAAKPSRLRPAPEPSWRTLVQTFELR